MWYKFAKQKFNIFGFPITGKNDYKQFASDEDDIIISPIIDDENINQIDTDLNTDIDPLVEVEDPTPEDEFTQDDLQNNIEVLENDPTVNLALPPLHSNCRCRIETRSILSQPGIRDGRRVWIIAQNCCGICDESARAFNEAEVQRLFNKGIDVNIIT